MRWLGLRLVVMVMALALSPAAFAQTKEVVIGVLYAMTGPTAQIGIDAVNAIKVVQDIVNTQHSPINVPLGKGAA